MNKDLLKHMVVLVLCQSAIEMMDRRYVPDLDMLSMYGQDVFYLLVLAVVERPAEL